MSAHSGGWRRWTVVSAATIAGACVAVDPAPNGIGSARLDAAPPSVAIGDTLRDSLGVPYRVRGVAFDANGNPVATAPFRYSYVPFAPDTSAGALVDTALVVDSATGAVRATRTWLRNGSNVAINRGRVVVRIGSVIQLADTIDIVPRANAVVPTAATYTLRYDCSDPGTFLIAADTSAAGRTRPANAVGPFSVVVNGDSVGRTVPVRRWLVRWTVDSAPVTPTPSAARRLLPRLPAIAIIPFGNDQVINYDTTDAVGTSNVRLRIRPAALGPAYSRDTLFRVLLRADVIGAGGVRLASPARGTFTVIMSRTTKPLIPSATCPSS